MQKDAAHESFSRVHFIGIGGAGMSGIALVLHERGFEVSGSDLKRSRYVRELESAGVRVFIGHEPATVDATNPEIVVISSAIPETNPELIRAREMGCEVWPRAKMLSYLSQGSTTVAIAGTHGKTTTSSMVATMLDKAGLDPSFLIGGVVEGYDTNGRNGAGPFVAEADESDGSFLFLNPDVVVVTNIEADHLDHYGTLENIEKTFCTFMSSVGEQGSVIVCGESAHVVELARSTGRKVLTYGFGPENDYVCSEATKHEHGLAMSFDISAHGQAFPVTIKANPGRHNILNAAASLAVADVLGVDLEKAASALSEFKGARRRFTHVGDVDAISVVDDYGHHPTEIRATLAAAQSLDFERVVVVFQPHRYSRTQDLAEEFGSAFDDADALYVMDVFSAGEMPIPGVSGKTVASAVKAHNSKLELSYVPKPQKLIKKLVEELRDGDVLITMGAGDVTQIGPNFIKARREHNEQSAS